MGITWRDLDFDLDPDTARAGHAPAAAIRRLNEPPRLHSRAMAALTIAAALAGCGEVASENAMADEEKPWWHDMYEEQKARSRERIAELIETSPTYPRPPADPDLQWSARGNKIIVVDRKTGDYLAYVGASMEGLLSSFAFTTRNGTFVVGFNTQMSGGFGMKWDRIPIRVYGIVEAKEPTAEVVEARKRMSLPRFAQYMAALPDYARNPERDFVVIHAPLEAGERLPP